MTAPTTVPAPTPRAKAQGSLWLLIASILGYAAVTLPPGLAVRVLWAEAFVTDGPSMEPTLLDGDRFVVDRTAVGLVLPGASESVTHWGELERGEVVVVNSPMDGVNIIKRVIGIAGDRVEIVEDAVLVNGAPLRHGEVTDCASADGHEEAVCYEERWGERRWRVLSDRFDTESMSVREVPPDHVLVLGDHRNRSNDSRNPLVGMIPLSRVVGVARLRYWSQSSQPLGWLE